MTWDGANNFIPFKYMITYRQLLKGLKELEINLPESLDFSVTVKHNDEYFGLIDKFTHFDDENPSGAGVIEEGTPILEILT